MSKLIGPFSQLLTMDQLPEHGPIKDESLEILKDVGIVVENGTISMIRDWAWLTKDFAGEITYIDHPVVVTPGFIDCHTHICFGGNRREDYAARLNGVTYQDIIRKGGGIWSTVNRTRNKTENQLVQLTTDRINRLLSRGITTCEVKSGYGLSIVEELKMLRAIQRAGAETSASIISTCLAAHVVPKDFQGDSQTYLQYLAEELLPVVKEEKLSNRVDIFIEENAFGIAESKAYLNKAKEMGFDLTVHGDQFTAGGSQVAIDCGAISVDHLEASGDLEIKALAQSETIGVALPGASIGLGCGFTPARKLLDAGGRLAIASDWNPGSAPMGNLLIQAAILGTMEKLTMAETLAGITVRSAQALNVADRGILAKHKKADFLLFKTDDYRDIFYHQGEYNPEKVFVGGKEI